MLFFSVWDRVFPTVNTQYIDFVKKKMDLCKEYDERKKQLNKEFNIQ